MSSIFLPFRLFIKSAAVKWLLLGIVAANLISWGLILWQLPEQLSLNLHYTVYFGIDWIGPHWYAYLFPLAGFVIAVVDFFTAWGFAKKLPILGLLLLTAGFFSELLLLTQSVIVVILNT